MKFAAACKLMRDVVFEELCSHFRQLDVFASRHVVHIDRLGFLWLQDCVSFLVMGPYKRESDAVVGIRIKSLYSNVTPCFSLLV